MSKIRFKAKPFLAFLFPFITTVATLSSDFVITGNFDMLKLRVAIGGLILSGVAALGAYIGSERESILEARIQPEDPSD